MKGSQLTLIEPGTPHASAVAERPASVSFSPPVDSFLRALERVEGIVRQETQALRNHQPVDLADLNRRKSHGLLELSRAMRGIDRTAARESIETSLRSLREALAANVDILQVHLDAVQEISTVMSRAIRDGESDGTYSAAARFRGPPA